MKTTDDPAARAAWAKQLVETTGGRAKRTDVLSTWERDTFFAGETVQLRVPLRDPQEVRRHLALVEETVRDLGRRLALIPMGDRTDLLTVHSVIRALNQKLNSYRMPRR